MTLSTFKPYSAHSASEKLDKNYQSLLMRDIISKVLSIAKLDFNVILVGESGSGKEWIAKTIHQYGKRAHKPFYSFYCVGICEDEYQEAFYGHLTYKDNHRPALHYHAIEEARGGIIYLDQFSELPLVYKLNIINSFVKSTEKLYQHDEINKPRLIISLNHESYQKTLNEEIWDSLLTKIDPVVIMLPPLRERKEDIPILIDLFINEIRINNDDYKNLSISNQALRECFNYSWPGNIRQLKNAIFHGATLSYGKTIELQHLPFSMGFKLPYDLN